MSLAYEARPVTALIREHRHLEAWFPFRYSFDLYSGCEYDCRYCRANWREKKKVVWKKNFLPLLKKELGQFSSPHLFGIGGGHNELFTPSTRSVTEKALALLSERGHRVFVMTKNTPAALPILTRLAHFKALAKKQRPIVLLSLNSVYEKELALLEQTPPNAQERLTAARRLKEAGFVVGLAIIPLIPFFNDDPLQLNALLEKAAEIQLDFVLMHFIDVAGLRRLFHSPLKEQLWPAERLSQLEFLLETPLAWKEHQRRCLSRHSQQLRRVGLLPLLPCYEVQDYLSRKDQVTLLLLQLYHYSALLGKPLEGYRFAAYSLNQITEQKFYALAKAGALQQLSGIGPYLGGAADGLIYSFLRGDLKRYKESLSQFLTCSA